MDSFSQFPHISQKLLKTYYLDNDDIARYAKVKSSYNPLGLGTVIVLVSSGIDFVNTPPLYSDRGTR